MELVGQIAQAIVALGILNVWLIRPGKQTAYRGGDATTMREEFAVYGLPYRAMLVIGALKITCAVMLLAGLWYPPLTVPAAITLGVLMVGAVVMHLKVRDPFVRAMPAAAMLALCVVVAVIHSGSATSSSL